MSKKPLAMVTMVFNEPDFLPIWLRYYGAQVGLENCYIIDHGSTDGSTDGLEPANVIRIPRTPLNEDDRCHFVAGLSNSLLIWFDYVAYTDVDEILFADPMRHESLIGYCGSARHDITTAFGMHLAHELATEWALLPTEKISRQRRWAMVGASMCKPLLIRRPVLWAPGFHYADDASYLDDLFLIHLAYCDLEIATRRQRKRRAVPRDESTGGDHHGAPDQAIISMMEGWCTMQRDGDVDLGPECPHRLEFTRRMFSTRSAGNSESQLDANVGLDRLWLMPDRFMDIY